MTNEEQNERYFMTISSGMVTIEDTETGQTVADFGGPDRLLAATTELNRLNAAEETARTGVTWQAWTPATLLAETLPELARRQQLESQLAQVEAIKEHARSEVQRWQEIAQSAFDLRNRIREALARPLSSTETDESAPGVGQDTLSAAIARSVRQVDITEILKAGTPLFKPQPY